MEEHHGKPTRPPDDLVDQPRDLPQLQSLLIAPLRPSVSSRILSAPPPLEPHAGGVHESSAPGKSQATVPATLPTPTEFLTAARAKHHDAFIESMLSLEPPPKPILPAFVNLQAVERLPYASFADEAAQLNRKRRCVDRQADSFGDHLHLPVPHAQREQQRPRPFGPFAILNGLNEPPPNAALLPPIEAGSIASLLTPPTKVDAIGEPSYTTANTTVEVTRSTERREGRIEEILDCPIVERPEPCEPEPQSAPVPRTEQTEPTELPDIVNADGMKAGVGKFSLEAVDEPMSPKTRGRSRKNLRRWTEEETVALLRGVVKCGIGNWTAILAQPELNFNKRTASNLKDRFRVCCPWAYRAADPNEAMKQLRATLASALLKTEMGGSNGTGDKIHLPDPRPASAGTEASSTPQNATSPASQAESQSSIKSPSLSHCSSVDSAASARTPSDSGTKLNSTCKSQHALDSFGIPEPHFTTKSRRRSRRPFSAAEDEALLKGYAVHGFQWTLIQQDQRLNLSHRRATDLRDRFRTKFPRAYRDGGSVSGNSGGYLSSPPESVRTSASAYEKCQPTIKRTVTGSSASIEYDRNQQTVRIPIGAALSPPAPPHGLLECNANQFISGSNHFGYDDHGSAGSHVENSWEDNTLPPLNWDEFS